MPLNLSRFVGLMSYLYGWMKTTLRRIHPWMTAALEGRIQNNRTIASLDGVRAIACLTVIGYHISLITRDTHLWSPTAPGILHHIFSSIVLAGASGVTLFFVLSGFLLFMPFCKAMLFETKWPSTITFYLRRAFRILPGYYVVLLSILLISHPAYLHVNHWQDLTLFFTLFMDATPGTFQQINGPFWTLAVEWQFYLLLPLLMIAFSLLVLRIPRRWRVYALVACLSGVVAWGIWSRTWGAYYTANAMQTFLVPRPIYNVFLFFTYGVGGKYLEDFAIGMLVSLIYMYVTQASFPGKFATVLCRLSPLYFIAGLSVLMMMALWLYNVRYFNSWPLFDRLSTPLYNDISEACLAGGFGLCIIAILLGPRWLRRPFEWSPLRWIGLTSYSLYMVHLPLLILFMVNVGYHMQGMNRSVGISLYIIWTLCVIFPISFLSFLLVEKPWVELGNKLLKKEKQAAKQDGDSHQERAIEERATERELVKW
ncbi:MAG TPA: acyltransferase [Ktedonobacteraceae bacterium]|nr:acyltransferase [Ktedonobacteraceae bacterium]